jgi:hypothetical protein
MKKKGLIIVLLCVMGLVALIGSAHAALGWNNLTNFEVGEIYGFYYIADLNTSPTGDAYWIIDPANRNTIVATALTCYANSSTLRGYYDPALVGSVLWGAAATKP